MTRAPLIILMLIAMFASPAHAVLLQAVDETPPTTDCAVTHGDFPVTLRPCYIPQYGLFEFGEWGPADDNPEFNITITVSRPTQVEVEYDQLYFLSTQHGPTPAYLTAIGVDSQVVPCAGGFQSGTPLDMPGSIGLPAMTRCIVTVQPGTHTFYALEAARKGASAFKGPGNQLLTVRYDP